MDKNLILTRCRKVYIHLRNNGIFYAGHNCGEYEAIDVFRREKTAISTMEANKKPQFWDTPEKATIKHRVAGFYLVPASLVEK